MSNIEDFEDIPYEDEGKLRYTAKDVQEIIRSEREKAKQYYDFERLKYLEAEKEFYKSTIKTILTKKYFGGE